MAWTFLGALFRSWSRRSSPARKPYRRRFARPWFEVLEDRTVPSAISWTGNGDGSSWGDASNWDSGTVPGPNDDAFISTIASARGVSGTDVAVHSLHSDSPVGVLGSMSLAADSAVTAVLSVTGSLDIQQGATLTLTGGATLAGTVTIEQGANLSIDANTVELDASSSPSDPGWRYTAVTGPGWIQVGSGAGLLNFYPAAVANLALGPGGTVSGTDTLEVTGTLLWSGGTMTGGGVTKVDSSATMSITGDDTKFLDWRTLDTYGTGTWTGAGNIETSRGAVIHNEVGATFAAENDAAVLDDTGDCLLINEGSLLKSAGTGATLLEIPVNTSNTVEVDTGTLSFLEGGSISGQFHVPATAATLEFAQGEFATGNTNIDGSGGTHIGRPNSNLVAALNMAAAPSAAVTTKINTYLFDRSEIRGGLYEQEQGTFLWYGGTVHGQGGTLMIDPGAVLDMTPAGAKSVYDSYTIVNKGQAILSTPDGLLMDNEAIFRNEVQGVFTASGQTLIQWGGQGQIGTDPPRFLNFGLFNASTDTTIPVGVPFDNTGNPNFHAGTPGTVNALSGTLDLQGGGISDAGTFQVSYGATLQMSSKITDASFEFRDGTEFTGSGVAVLLAPAKESGTVHVDCEFRMKNDLDVAGLLIAGNTFLWRLGQLDGKGTGTFLVAAGGTLKIPTDSAKVAWGLTLENDGTVAVLGTGQLSLADNTVINNHGLFFLGAASLEAFNAAGGTVNNYDDFSVLGDGPQGIDVPFNQRAGQLDIATAAGAVQTVTVKFRAAFTQTGGTTYLNGNNIDATAGSFDLNGGYFEGPGAFSGAFSNNSAVVEMLGAQLGSLQITGTYSQGAAGVLNLRVADSAHYDQLTVSDVASLGGTINVTSTTSSPVLVLPIITYKQRLNWFATVNIDSPHPDSVLDPGDTQASFSELDA